MTYRRIGSALLFAFLLSVTATGAAAQELMPATASAWTGFSARPESAPGLLASAEGSGYSLHVDGNGVPSVYGGWRTRIQGLSGSHYYRLRARAAVTDIPSPRESITVLLRWRGSFSDIVAPDYVWEYRTQPDGSLLFDRTVQAPPGTSGVDIELALQWASGGRVRFDALSLTPSTAPAPRPVKAVAVHYRPQGTASGLESVQRAAAHGQQVAAAEQPDVMVFGEMLNVIGAPGTFDQKAEAIPGASTGVMANLARTYRTYVAFGMLEREGSLLYNSAVLLDRSGNIAGKYRKMQLPLSEVASGITPGSSVPVFQTDVGRLALLICQDVAFPEPVREAAIQGAEMLLVPIWGGKASATAARAIEHSMYVVASGYDYMTEVLDPLGSAVARVDTVWQPGAAAASIDLTRRFREDWVGDWRDVVNKQRRRLPSPYRANDTTPDGGTQPPPAAENVPPTVNITSPTAGAAFTAPATIDIVASANDSDGTVSRVDFYSGTTLLGSDSTGPYAFRWTNVAAGHHALSARAIDSASASTTSATVNITVSAAPPQPTLPSAWQSQDIGAVGAAGSASESGGTFTLRGAGADIWGSADGLHYAWQRLSGDVDVIARVASLEYVHAWSKAGVMIRERLTADSSQALMLASADRGFAFQRRLAPGGVSTSTSGGAGTAPGWVKLERRANVITAFRSADGMSWTVVGSDSFAMAADVYVGLAVTSHDVSRTATATFDQVTVRPAGAATPPPPGPTPPPSGGQEIVLHAADATRVAGTWRLVADASAASGQRAWNPNAGRPKVVPALAAPADFIELTFNAEAGRAYHLWIRGKAEDDGWANDSAHVQFSGAVDAQGAPVYRIGTAASAEYVVESCSGCGLSGWGWEDNAWGIGAPVPLIYFATTGPQTIRIQTREDGLSIDQIVLSSGTYLNASPGAAKDDTTVLPRR